MHLPVERDIPAGSYNARRKAVVMVVNQTRRRSHRRTFVVSLLTLGAVASGGGIAVAADAVITHQSNGVDVVNSDQLRVDYNGVIISQSDLLALNAEGKGLFQATDIPSARSGVMHAFDTEAQLDAYRAQYLSDALQPSHLPTPHLSTGIASPQSH